MPKVFARLGVILLAICRTVYCWFFLYCSLILIYSVYTNLRGLTGERSEAVFTIVNIEFAVFSLVLGTAWWMIFRKKPDSKLWAIAASLAFVFTHADALIVGNWRGFLNLELKYWPLRLIGITGIIVFSIPYHGWRRRSQERELVTQS